MILDATTVPEDSYLAPGKLSPLLGYGYQVWIAKSVRRRFSLLGIHGQAVFVDPATKLVLVHTAVRLHPEATAQDLELVALWYAVLAQYGAK
ncbi:MAG TPA: hypothetical protein VLX85_13765 [Stellaceae bacterium]|nr:hypothetical protein [Stellaceae bacterium]